MTRREQEALPSLLFFVAGVLAALGFALLTGVIELREEKELHVAGPVIACSQAAEMCKAAAK